MKFRMVWWTVFEALIWRIVRLGMAKSRYAYKFFLSLKKVPAASFFFFFFFSLSAACFPFYLTNNVCIISTFHGSSSWAADQFKNPDGPYRNFKSHRSRIFIYVAKWGRAIDALECERVGPGVHTATCINRAIQTWIMILLQKKVTSCRLEIQLRLACQVFTKHPAIFLLIASIFV